MKDSIKIYNRAIFLQRERSRLQEQLTNVQRQLVVFNRQCEHELVFQLTDNHLHKIGVLITCFCPICGKKDAIHDGKPIMLTPFSKSKIIDLTKIQVANMDKALELIRDEVTHNLNYYYDENKESSELEENLYSVINSKSKTKINQYKPRIRTSTVDNK